MTSLQWLYREELSMTVLVDRPHAVGRRTWTRACRRDALLPGRGVAALLPGGEQVALFLLPDQTLAAVSNVDPFGGAAVMSRGITGDRRGEPTVASPLLKQVFSLRDGRCLDDVPGGDAHALRVYDVRTCDGFVELASK
jgi:nitrite reductase (NADH) small subunit